ncbi:MAG: DUF6588 family protein [Balneolaceae bacterium]|nr:DUF6588 family protein [Balneolaceae bacterium]
MKKGYRLFTGALFALLVFFFNQNPVNAQQIDDIGIIIQSGADDANILAQEYLNPFGKGFGAGLNSGWFHNAKPHKKFGFDITVNASLALVPSSYENFSAAAVNSRLSRLQWDQASPDQTPTINGSKNVTTSRFTITEQGQNLGGFEMPTGTGFQFVPSPMIQASVGLIANTDVTLRFLPEYTNDEFGRIKLFGVGLKHGINQWLPGGKLLPVDLSVQAGFTTLEVDGNLSLTPQDFQQQPDSNPFPASEWEGQKVTTSTNAFTANALVGKKLPFISFFAGVGFQSATMEVETVGNYPIPVPDESTADPTDTTVESLAGEDILNFEIESANSVHALAGLTLKLAFFQISGSFTVSEFPVAQASVGFSFR